MIAAVRRGAGVIALLVLVARVSPSLAAPPVARSIAHVVKSGDTWESVAAMYYGERGQGIFIRELNGEGTRLQAGQKLRIPTAITVKARKGESLASLASLYLGDARRARFLAEWNGLKTGAIAPGTPVLVPFHLVHRAPAPESLATLAKTFYGDAAQGKLLGAYNFRGGLLLSRGERVIIPVPHVRIKPAVMALIERAQARGRTAALPSVPGDQVSEVGASQAAPSPSPPSSAPATPPPAEVSAHEPIAMPASSGVVPAAPSVAGAGRIAERIKQADRAFRDGNFEDAQSQLSRLLDEGGATPPQLLAIHRLLGFVYATLGADEDAVREFRDVLSRDPALRLDEAQVSPRIRTVFERARDRVQP